MMLLDFVREIEMSFSKILLRLCKLVKSRFHSLSFISSLVMDCVFAEMLNSTVNCD